MQLYNQTLLFLAHSESKMVGCSAFGCSNRSEQGYLMKVFLKNPERRKNGPLW